MILHSLLEWLDILSFLIFLCIFLLLIDFLKYKNPPNYPPGPRTLPFVGNTFIDLEPKTILKLSKKYGNIFSLRKGNEKIVFTCGYKLAKEVLVNQGDNFVDRHDIPLFNEVFKGLGIISSNGHMWKRQRKFAGTHLKNFGEGKKTLELHIQRESAFLCQALKDERGGPFNPQMIIINAIANVICTVVFGHRYDYTDAYFQNILRLDAECIYLSGTPRVQLFNICPRLFKLLPGTHQTIFSNYTKITDFLRQEIENHRKNWDPSDPRDYIDTYLGEINKMTDDSQAGFNIENLTVCALDFFEAGTESTATTLRWGLLFMMKYPEVQSMFHMSALSFPKNGLCLQDEGHNRVPLLEKVQAEIGRVIGQSRQPNMADKANMPYTDAVVHEIQRAADILPLGFPKIAKKDTTLGGYFIPKGTLVTSNLSSVLNDKSEWETPESFNPGHFLDSMGQFRRRDAFYPFSAGMRVCLGEQLARMELFLFLTSLPQRFTFSPPPGVEPDLEGVLGFTYAPKAFSVCAVPR